jgi:hypothetical protein
MKSLNQCVQKISEATAKIVMLGDTVSPSDFASIFEPALSDIEAISIQVAGMEVFIEQNKDKALTEEQINNIASATSLAIAVINDISSEVETSLGK